MEDIITIDTFLENLTYYLKLTVYSNKGTLNENLLEFCISLHNKLKINESDISKRDIDFIRRILKRLNLSLKIDNKNKPVDISNKENQKIILKLSGHKSLYDNNLEEMIDYIKVHDIMVITNLSLRFIFTNTKYQDLLWQYTRLLFFTTQFLLSKHKKNNENSIGYQVYQESLTFIESVLVLITEIENKHKINNLLEADYFITSKLSNIKLNENNVSEANLEVKRLFNKRCGNDSMSKMIDSISAKLTQTDLNSGNITKNIIGIAKNIAMEVKDEIGTNPENLQNTIGSITNVLKDVMNNSNMDEIPFGLKGILNKFVSTTEDTNIDNTELINEIGTFAEANGLDKDEILNNMINGQGELDMMKVETFIKNNAKY